MIATIDNELAHGCWKRIGVAGDASCDALALHIHCRNCPTYSAAAQRTMQQPVDDAYRASWAGQLRRPEQAPEPGGTAALAFRIGAEWLALPLSMVKSVAPLAPPHRLPHRTPPGLLGVVNVGGRLAPAVSLAALLCIDEDDAQAITGRQVFARLLVVDAQGTACAIPVAELHGALRYAATSLVQPAATVERPRPDHLEGVLAHGGMQVGVLNGALVAQRLAGLLR